MLRQGSPTIVRSEMQGSSGSKQLLGNFSEDKDLGQLSADCAPAASGKFAGGVTGRSRPRLLAHPPRLQVKMRDPLRLGCNRDTGFGLLYQRF